MINIKYPFFILLILACAACEQRPKAVKNQVVKKDFCSEITETYDKFDSVYFYKTPDVGVPTGYNRISLSVSKTIKKQGTSYMLTVSTGAYSTGNKAGTTLLLSDGSRIDKPDAFVVCRKNEVDSSYFSISKIVLNQSELAKLSKAGITDVQLADFKAVNPEPDKFRQYLACLIGKNPPKTAQKSEENSN